VIEAPAPIAFVPAARPPRRAIDPVTRRRLSRLSRAAHRFHRFAHHPLCERYAREVVRVGRVRLCRGCTYAIAGGVAGGTLGLVLGASTVIPVVATTAGTALLLATLWARRRVTKLATRLVPASSFALAITCGVLSLQPIGFAAASAAIAVVGGLRLLYGKRGADRTPCTTCPELVHLGACSGFAPIVRRERAFQRVARNVIAR
jgi:hypothetical protein